MWNKILQFVQSHKTETLYTIGIVLICVLSPKLYAQSLYEYKGVYSVNDVLTNYCDNCFLQLPAEYLQTNIVLSVSTDKKGELLTAIKKASYANGWQLVSTGHTLKAEPIENADKIPYISCMDYQVVNVPKYLYSATIKADKLLCAKRDSLQRYTKDSIQSKLQQIKDSLAQIKPLSYIKYRLLFYSFTKTFSDKMGVSWKNVLAAGNLKKIPTFYDAWYLTALEQKDTSFTYRSLSVSLDTTSNIDWGNEIQSISKTYVSTNGYVTSDYEWRKYGMIIKLTRSKTDVTLDYIFREKGTSGDISVLQGTQTAIVNDTLHLTGTYNVVSTSSAGLPFLSRIPLLGYLFSQKENTIDTRHFDIFLLPLAD